MENKKCEYSKCTVEFAPTDAKKRFCCDEHRWAAARERRKANALGNVSVSESTTSTNTRTPETRMPETRPHMDMTSFLFNRLENEIKDLKEQLKERNAEIKSLTDEKTKVMAEGQAKEREYERKILEMQGAIDAKPTGLNGIMQTSAAEKFIEGIAPFIGPKLSGLMDKITGPSSPHADEITRWMLTLPENMRNDVLIMLQGFMQLPPEKITEKMSEVARSLMATSTPEQQKQIQKNGTLSFWS